MLQPPAEEESAEPVRLDNDYMSYRPTELLSGVYAERSTSRRGQLSATSGERFAMSFTKHPAPRPAALCPAPRSSGSRWLFEIRRWHCFGRVNVTYGTSPSYQRMGSLPDTTLRPWVSSMFMPRMYCSKVVQGSVGEELRVFPEGRKAGKER